MTSSLIELTSIPGFQVAGTIGTVSFTIAGFLVGVKKHLDIMGVFIVAALTAFGGGTIRDVILGRIPAVFVSSIPLLTMILVMLVVFCLKLHRKNNLERKFIFVVSDSIGLVAFSITGALLGIDASLSIFGVMFLAFLTAVGGGIVRDMLVNDIPCLFKSGVYGSVALLVGFMLYCLAETEYISVISIGAVGTIALSLRLTAYVKDWHLPKL